MAENRELRFSVSARMLPCLLTATASLCASPIHWELLVVSQGTVTNGGPASAPWCTPLEPAQQLGPTVHATTMVSWRNIRALPLNYSTVYRMARKILSLAAPASNEGKVVSCFLEKHLPWWRTSLKKLYSFTFHNCTCVDQSVSICTFVSNEPFIVSKHLFHHISNEQEWVFFIVKSL
jgi:hypothetical protein